MKQAHIKTLGDLVQKSEAEMLKFRNFGKKSLGEMNDIMSSYGLSFGMDIEKYKKGAKIEEQDFELPLPLPIMRGKKEEEGKKEK
jgi:DNA-directed RNA polymerase alpha subunit